MKSSGYLSFGAQWGDPISADRIKLATLLFDEVQAVGTPKLNAATIAEWYGGSKDSDPRIVTRLSDVWKSVDGAKVEEFCLYKGPDGKFPWELSDDSLLTSVSSALDELHHGREDLGNYEATKFAMFVANDIRWWRYYGPESTYIGDRFSERSLQVWAGPASVGSVKSVHHSLPSIGELCWDDVLDLRTSDFLKDFRKKYWSLRIAPDPRYLLDEYYNCMEDLFSQLRPSMTMLATEAVLENLPVPVNPFGYIKSAKEAIDAYNLRKEHGWVFFLNEFRMKEKSSEHNSTKRS